MSGISQKRRKKRYLGLYTTGQINKIIDGYLHPFFGAEKISIFLDAGAHALLEQDVPESAGKFVRYSLPVLLKQTGKKCTVRRKRSKK